MLGWEIETAGDSTRITLRGTLGIADAGPLRLALLDVLGRERPASVECSGLEHIDCAAAQVLLSFAAAMRRRSLEVAWSPFPERPLEYLALSGLADHFAGSAAATLETTP